MRSRECCALQLCSVPSLFMHSIFCLSETPRFDYSSMALQPGIFFESCDLKCKAFPLFFLTFLITPVLLLSLVVNILVTNPCRPFCIYSKSDAVFPTRGTAAMNWSFSLTFVLKTFRFTGIKVIFPQAVPRLLRRLALLKETRRTQKECLYLM